MFPLFFKIFCYLYLFPGKYKKIVNEYVIFHFSGAEVSDDGRYVLIIVRNGCDPVNKLYYVDLEKINYKIKGV